MLQPSCESADRAALRIKLPVPLSGLPPGDANLRALTLMGNRPAHIDVHVKRHPAIPYATIDAHTEYIHVEYRIPERASMQCRQGLA